MKLCEVDCLVVLATSFDLKNLIGLRRQSSLLESNSVWSRCVSEA